MKRWFYYFRDSNNQPVITVCLIKDKSGDIARGIAICSKKDNFRKKDDAVLLNKRYRLVTGGRTIAYQRAIEALKSKKTTLPIKSERAMDIVMNSNYDLCNNRHTLSLYKSVYNPTLTAFENKLINKRKFISDASKDLTDKSYDFYFDIAHLYDLIFINGNRNINIDRFIYL